MNSKLFEIIPWTGQETVEDFIQSKLAYVHCGEYVEIVRVK